MCCTPYVNWFGGFVKQLYYFKDVRSTRGYKTFSPTLNGMAEKIFTEIWAHSQFSGSFSFIFINKCVPASLDIYIYIVLRIFNNGICLCFVRHTIIIMSTGKNPWNKIFRRKIINWGLACLFQGLDIFRGSFL